MNGVLQIAGASIATLCCAVTMVSLVVEDLRERLLPKKLCRVLAICGCAVQLFLYGSAGFTWGLVYAIAVILSCGIASIGFKQATGEDALGGGDVRCMAALCLASGEWAPLGFAACFCAAGGWGLYRIATRSSTWKDTFPLGPFLAIWLITGLGATFASTLFF